MSEEDPATAVTTPGISPIPDLAPTKRDPEAQAMSAGDPQAVSAFDPPARRFELQGELGRGGMGYVVEAMDHALGRQVAIKQMISTNVVDLRRFEREARITARLEHPSIVPIHDAGRHPDGTPYYVMRRVDGRPLDQLVEKHALVERVALVPHVLASCDAVAYAHARGIIHRDIKPTNILIGPFGETLLIDWGLARELGDTEPDPTIPSSVDEHLTRVGTVAGTPGFMAPEQARGEAVDRRTDVFALGATLFYVLAGRAPYASQSATEMIRLVALDRTPDWKLIPEGVPPDLRAIVAKAMASEPVARYAHAGELAADLRRFTTGQLVRAYRYGRRARLVRFARRNRAALAVGVISMALLAALLAIGGRRIVAERDEATAARASAELRQREAVETADRLLVQHALELAAIDPSTSIAVLRSLPAGSTRWAEAAVAAEAAHAHGIPFGFADAPSPIYRIGISKNSKRALSATIAGTLAVIDLEARVRHELPNLPASPYGITWFDDARIAYGLEDHVTLIDATTGAVSRTIAVPARVSNIYGDHAGKLMIEAGHDVYELDGEATEVGRPVLTDLELFEPARDLASAVIRRHQELSWWSPSGIVRIGPAGRWQTAAVDGNDVATLDDGVVRQWRIADGVATETLHTTGSHLLAITLADGELFAFDGTGLVRFSKRGAFVTETDVVNVLADGPGIIAPSADGSIDLHDRSGWFKLGKRAATYNRVAWSADSRFVVATTLAGTLLVWDLPTFRPRSIDLEVGEAVSALTGNSLWTRSAGDGVYVRNLATNAHARLFAAETLLIRVSADEHWVVGLDPITHRATIFYVPTNRISRLDDAMLVAAGGSGIYACSSTGRVIRFDGDVTSGKQLAQLAAGPSFITAAGRFMVIADDQGRITRFETAGKLVETRVTGEVTGGTINPETGEVWLVVNGTVVHWNGVQPPTTLAVPGPITLVTWTPHGLVTDSRGVLYRADVTPPRLLANNLFQYFVHDSLVPTVTPQRIITIHDLPTSLSFQLPVVSVGIPDLIAHDRQVGYSVENDRSDHKLAFLIWSFNVPSEPDALRTWLSTITNATSSDGEAVSWPTH